MLKALSTLKYNLSLDNFGCVQSVLFLLKLKGISLISKNRRLRSLQYCTTFFCEKLTIPMGKISQYHLFLRYRAKTYVFQKLFEIRKRFRILLTWKVHFTRNMICLSLFTVTKRTLIGLLSFILSRKFYTKFYINCQVFLRESNQIKQYFCGSKKILLTLARFRNHTKNKIEKIKKFMF